MSGIRFRKEFGNIDKFSIKFGCRIIANFDFPIKFGRIAVFYFFIQINQLFYLSFQLHYQNNKIKLLKKEK